MRAWIVASLALCLVACNRDGETPATFDVAHGPGPVERIECRQGECYWSQRQSVTILSRSGDGIMLKVAGRYGNSIHGLEGEPPRQWEAGIKVDWQAETTYFLCSLTRPAILWKSDTEFLLDRLDLHSPPGVQVASANEYMAVCHSLAPEKWNERTLQQLGYARTASDQAHYPMLDAGLKAMVR